MLGRSLHWVNNRKTRSHTKAWTPCGHILRAHPAKKSVGCCRRDLSEILKWSKSQKMPNHVNTIYRLSSSEEKIGNTQQPWKRQLKNDASHKCPTKFLSTITLFAAVLHQNCSHLTIWHTMRICFFLIAIVAVKVSRTTAGTDLTSLRQKNFMFLETIFFKELTFKISSLDGGFDLLWRKLCKTSQNFIQTGI